jgi:hypothetical protein
VENEILNEPKRDGSRRDIAKMEKEIIRSKNGITRIENI